MTAGLTSIIIPTCNRAALLREAIASALAQTAPVEVIVIDDGSVDETQEVLDQVSDSRLRTIWQRHAGPSDARNRGIDAARGEFVMFLDDDDVISPTKVADQIAAFDDAIGWVLCDVEIRDAIRGRTELASERYRYRDRGLGGWIREQLAAANFIPIMSPLIRRSVLTEDVRFVDRQPEDWHFWYRLAAHARVRYLPKVLATYRKRRGGRSSLGLASMAPTDGGPLLLNLGCGTPGAASWHPMPDCVNLDRSLGWCFEDGLQQYGDGSVDGITISHALMYVAESDWPHVFAEFARVLKPGGVIRITEDDTAHPLSSRRGGWRGSEPAVTLTSVAQVVAALESSGLSAREVAEVETGFVDDRLRQAQHGAAPDVFFVEGQAPTAVLFSPHADDETLFASAAVMADRPRVVICCPSTGDYGSTEERFAESTEAVRILGGCGTEQWDGQDIDARMRAYDMRWRPMVVWAPHPQASHPDHRTVAEAALRVFGARVRQFHTYDGDGKVRAGVEATFAPDGLLRKIQARACYHSQISHPRASMFFQWDLTEYQECAP